MIFLIEKKNHIKQTDKNEWYDSFEIILSTHSEFRIELQSSDFIFFARATKHLPTREDHTLIGFNESVS